MAYTSFYSDSLNNPNAFWAEQAAALDWFQFPTSILSKDKNDLYQWYKGGNSTPHTWNRTIMSRMDVETKRL